MPIFQWDENTDASRRPTIWAGKGDAALVRKELGVEKGTEVVAVEAGGGPTRPILKLRTVKNETGYIYVEDFKRQFAVPKGEQK